MTGCLHRRGMPSHPPHPRSLTNVNTYHARCAQGVPCGGHAWSYDAVAFSNFTVGAFGPSLRFANGSYWLNAYAERPQVVLVRA